jgi:TetR/AcrR family transcriptional regulator
MKTRIQLRNEERILDAAQEVFATYGYQGATIDEVADRAGISKPNLHYYFKRKRDLYLAVLRRTLEIWLVPLRELDRTGDPAEEIGGYIAQKVQLSALPPHRASSPMRSCRRAVPEGYLQTICGKWSSARRL